MSEINIDNFEALLKDGGPVAIVVKQSLASVSGDDAIIFPPSYPLKNEKNTDQTPGYNIDRFPDGANSCEVDSPQSQANRIEPEFKKPIYRHLVPQVEIKVGSDSTNAVTVNLLDAGHRAADAVVRLSSLADKFHTAFLDVKADNHFTLATLAPTSLLFGVWDSRSTQVKLQRILKASIRADNIRECRRSAQFTPAADYVAAGAIGADLDQGKSDQNPLSSEGMKHALAVQTVGGVMLTPTSKLTRTVNLNLVALRALRASDAPRTEALQRYILGLALLAATIEQDLNLREGCNLRFEDKEDKPMEVPRRGEAKPMVLDYGAILPFATASAKKFFEVAGIPFDKKDHPNAVFEAGVAEEFLGLKSEDRDKVKSLGPITGATLKRFRDSLSSDPFKPLADLLKTAKAALPKPSKGQSPTRNPETLQPIFDALKLLSEDNVLPDNVKALASELAGLAEEQPDSNAALKQIETKLRAFKKSQKDVTNTSVGTGDAEPSK